MQRVGVDLESLHKAERQQGRGTWISPHRVQDLERLAPALTRAQPFARVNPLHAGSNVEVESVLAAGAAVLMLPMVASADEAAAFTGLVAGRARVVLLIERREAIDRLSALVAVPGVDEVHLGLNDLAISLGLPNRWLVMASELPMDAAILVRGAGLQFGLGGIGRVDDPALPIASDLIYAEYARTGATGALLSRSFVAGATVNLAREVERARQRLAAWRRRDADTLGAAHAELGRRARSFREW